MVVKPARIERVEHTARFVQLEGGLPELKGELDFMEWRNSIADLQLSGLVDKEDSMKVQIASAEICSGVGVQRLDNSSTYFNALIDGLNHQAAHTLRTIGVIYCNDFIAQAEHV